MRRPQPGNIDRLVVFLHGAFKDSSSMNDLAHYFDREGIATLNISYPSTQTGTLHDLSNHVWHAIEDNAKVFDGAREVDFIGHSMGGVVLRHMLYEHDHEINKPSKVVMIGTPNQGSILIDWMKRNVFLAAMLSTQFNFLGSPIRELSTDKDHPLLDRRHPVCIIAGTAGCDPNFPQVAPYLADMTKRMFGDFSDTFNDGVVTVKSTKLPVMDQHLTMPYAHTLLPRTPEVMHQAAMFLGVESEHENPALHHQAA